MNKRTKWVAWLALILSVVATINGLYDVSKPINESYLGLLIASFALLVTILVGWNVWSVYDTKKELDQFKEDIEANKTLTINQMSLLNFQIHSSLYTFFKENKEGNEGRYFIEAIITVSHAICCKDFTTAKSLVDTLIDDLNNNIGDKIKAYDRGIIVANAEILPEVVDGVAKIKHLTKALLIK